MMFGLNTRPLTRCARSVSCSLTHNNLPQAPWIESDPDVDAVVIVDVHGPMIKHKKWIYASSVAYIQIEPAWLQGLSAGVLSPRIFDAGAGEGKETRAIKAFIDAGDWPLASLRRLMSGANSAEDDSAGDDGNGDGSDNSTSTKVDSSMSRDECADEAARLGKGGIADSTCRADDCAPKGCYIYTPQNMIYWNKDKTGLCSAKRICLSNPSIAASSGALPVDSNRSSSSAAGSVTKAAADFISMDTYQMIKAGLGAPLTRDVLAFKTLQHGSRVYSPDGLGGFRAVSKGWTQNGSLVAALILSALLAATMAMLSFVLLRRFGKHLLLVFLQGLVQKEKEAHIGAIRDGIYKRKEEEAEAATEAKEAEQPGKASASSVAARFGAATRQKHTDDDFKKGADLYDAAEVKRQRRERQLAMRRCKKTIDTIGSPLGLSGFFAEPGRTNVEVEKALAVARALDIDGENHKDLRHTRHNDSLAAAPPSLSVNKLQLPATGSGNSSQPTMKDDLALLDELMGDGPNTARRARVMWRKAHGEAVAEAKRILAGGGGGRGGKMMNVKLTPAEKAKLNLDATGQTHGVGGLDDRKKKAANQKGRYGYQLMVGCGQLCGRQGGGNTVKHTWDISKYAAPSPFAIPSILLRDYLQPEGSSVTAFLQGDMCFTADESEFWSTDGCTSVRRFTRLYSEYCDNNDTQEKPVLKCTEQLLRFGVTIESRLMPVVLKMKLSTKADRRRLGAHTIGKSYDEYHAEALRMFADHMPAEETMAGNDAHYCQMRSLDGASIAPKGSMKWATKNHAAKHSASVIPHGPWCHGKPAHEVVRDEVSDSGAIKKVGTSCNVRCAGCRAVRRLAYHHFIYESGEIHNTEDDVDFITFDDLSQVFEYVMSGACAKRSEQRDRDGGRQWGSGTEKDRKIWGVCVCVCVCGCVFLLLRIPIGTCRDRERET